MSTAEPMVADLRAESDDLDGLVADLPAARWAEATPAQGWTIAHQIAHLLWTDRVALLSVTDEAGFGKVDPIMALFNAAHLMSLNPEPQGSVYSAERGLLVLSI